MQEIKEMIENGFAIKRIAKILNISEVEIQKNIKDNNLSLKKETFDSNKIEEICKLYEQGVSAKQLGIKFSIDKRRIQKWVKEKDLLRDKSESNRITYFNEYIFDVIDSPEKAYWLGFFYADAYNCGKTNTFSLTLKDEDYDHLVKLCNFVGLPVNKIKKYNSHIKEKEYPTCCVRLYSKHLCDKMTELGCPQAKSFIIKYPEWLDSKYNIDFIRGMFDGDGSLARRENNEWKWSLATTKECGEYIQNIILKDLSIIVNLSYISKTNNNTYELESNGNEKVLKLADYLYKDCGVKLDRKYNKYLELIAQQNNRTFSRVAYKVSEEEKFKMVNELEKKVPITQIAAEHKVHPRTVSKIAKENSYLYEKLAVVNGQQITTKYVKTLDYDERMALVEPLFEHFRSQGWMYPDNDSKLKASYQKLCSFKPDLNSNEVFNNSSLATDICKYFCHKFYDATERNKATMKEVFNDDEKLRYLIKNRLGFDWWDKEDNDETFNICFRMLIQGMRSSRLVPSISIFKPAIAKYMYMKYSMPGDTVYDYSCGWGGRLLGAASCGRKYIGVDPWTTDELQKIINYLDLKDITIHNECSENYRGEENSIDFSFSSPPYYDQEVYSKDDKQAYNKGEEHFYEVYWKGTLDNIKYMLKPGKYFGLNITNNYPKMLSMAEEVFGKVQEEVKMRTIKSHLNKTSGIQKHEPIFIFKNDK